MLEKPDIREEIIVASIRAEFGLQVNQIKFLPLGADLNTAVYQAISGDATSYFVKLRKGEFEKTAVALPEFLSDLGILQIIAPLRTKAGRLWANLDTFRLILYPFINGRNGYEVELSDRQWIDFGRTLKNIHTAIIPTALKRQIRRETFSPSGREIVRMYMKRVELTSFDDPVASKLAVFLRTKHTETLDLIKRAERLAEVLRAGSPKYIVCHSDIHAGNILIDAKDNLHIVDWDNPILAPKERDLMFAGGGQFGLRRAPEEEETLFYRGYGETQIDPIALAYYRYERIVQDIAAYCEQLFLTNEGGLDREQSLRYLESNFVPKGTIEIAYQSDKTSRYI
jgi:spectinomycin phosphotransferase